MIRTHARTLWQISILFIFSGIVLGSFFLQSRSLFPFSLIPFLQSQEGILGDIGHTGKLWFLFMVLTWLVLGSLLFPILKILKSI